jgi:tetratricopeptide (TPR) repeat protein
LLQCRPFLSLPKKSSKVKSLSPTSFACSAVASLLILAACSESKETRVQRFLAQGNDMVRKQNFEEAMSYYEGALKLDSCFADALNNLGSVHHRQGNFAKANDLYSKAIRCNPDFISGYLNRANTRYELNRLDDALEDLKRVEAVKPDTVALPFSRGLIYTRLRDYPNAKRQFKKALQINPENQELAINMGTVYYYEGDYDSARFYLLPVINSNPHPDAYNTLAMIATENEQYDEALNLVTKALALAPKNPYILNNRGYTYLLTGELEKGIDDINESITLDPYNGWAYRNKGIYYLMKNEPVAAIRLLKHAEGIDPDIKDLNTYLAKAYQLNHEEDLARTYREKALQKVGASN